MKYENITYQNERELYALKDSEVINCKFEGENDGESPLKEGSNLNVSNCLFALRYPMWHDNYLSLSNSTLTNSCRASLWYSKNIKINNVLCDGIKSIRECQNVKIDNSTFNSDEFGWKSKNLTLNNSFFTSSYFLFASKNVFLDKCKLNGKYSFQYIKNLKVDNSYFDTKDAFWHVKNGIIKNSTLKGEYIGWYSKNLTLINCKIIGTQPFCYCKNLKLINCVMENTDLAFENSSVKASILGNIDSIKNPLKGKIIVDNVDKIILEDYKNKPKAKIIIRKK